MSQSPAQGQDQRGMEGGSDHNHAQGQWNHHSQSHGHGHGDPHVHSHAQQDAAQAAHWDGEAYIKRPGIAETALVSADCVINALMQAGLTTEDMKGMHLLEIGCGPGLVTSHLLSHFASIHSIDPSPSQLQTFSTRISSPLATHSLHALSSSSPSEFLSPLVSPLPEEPNRRLTPPRARFDVAVANLVIHHVRDVGDFMRGVKGLLGGEGAVDDVDQSGAGGVEKNEKDEKNEQESRNDDTKTGWFVMTEFGKSDEGPDVAKEMREKKAREDKAAGKEPTHHHIHHDALSPPHARDALLGQGLVDVYAELRGSLPVFGYKGDGKGGQEVPCLVARGRVPRV